MVSDKQVYLLLFVIILTEYIVSSDISVVEEGLSPIYHVADDKEAIFVLPVKANVGFDFEKLTVEFYKEATKMPGDALKESGTDAGVMNYKFKYSTKTAGKTVYNVKILVNGKEIIKQSFTIIVFGEWRFYVNILTKKYIVFR